MKMYIVIKDWVPSGWAVNAAAHAGLIGWLEFKDLPETQDWLDNSFKKVTCMVTEEQFEELKRVPGNKVITESRLDGAEIAMVFAPRAKQNWPEIMNQLKLWK